MEAHPDIHPDEIRFFEQAERTTLLPLYALLRQALRARCNPVEIRVQRTQISFYNRRLFGAVSFCRRGAGWGGARPILR